jgi:hypothetical protein
MIRKLVVLLMGAALALALAAPASAHVDAFDWGVLSIGFDNDNGFATGVITCTSGETWLVSLRITQKATGYRGTGSQTGTCTGSSQNWSVNTTTNTGDAQEGSSVQFLIIAKTFAGGVADDKERILVGPG